MVKATNTRKVNETLEKVTKNDMKSVIKKKGITAVCPFESD